MRRPLLCWLVGTAVGLSCGFLFVACTDPPEWLRQWMGWAATGLGAFLGHFKDQKQGG